MFPCQIHSDLVQRSTIRLSSTHLSLPPGVQPAGEAWSADCVLAFQRRISNRRLRIEIQGAHEGKTLVAMTDENSDPQANIAELLTSAGFSTPSPPPPPPVQPSDPEAAAAREPQGDSTLLLLLFIIKHEAFI